MNSTINTDLQNSRSISFLAEKIGLNFFGFFDKWVLVLCSNYAVVSTFTNETQVPSPVTRMM
jgi:hypothetical protein